MPSFHHHHLLLLSLLLLLSSLPITSFANLALPKISAPLQPPPAPLAGNFASSATKARDAVSTALASAHAAHAFLLSLPLSPNTMERATAHDCAEQLAGAEAELARTEAELGNLRPDTFHMQLQNAQTWTSAADTNTYMCLDALRGISGATAAAAAPKVSDASRSTSNALYLVNRCATIGNRHH